MVPPGPEAKIAKHIVTYWKSEMLGTIFRKPQFFSLEISGPKVVKNVRCNGRFGPLSRPGTTRLQPYQPHG